MARVRRGPWRWRSHSRTRRSKAGISSRGSKTGTPFTRELPHFALPERASKGLLGGARIRFAQIGTDATGTLEHDVAVRIDQKRNSASSGQRRQMAEFGRSARGIVEHVREPVGRQRFAHQPALGRGFVAPELERHFWSSRGSSFGRARAASGARQPARGGRQRSQARAERGLARSVMIEQILDDRVGTINDRHRVGIQERGDLLAPTNAQ